MRKRVLVVAENAALRARFARMLQQAGYVVELAADGRRAIDLASGGLIESAIVVPRAETDGRAILEQLGEHVPKLVVLAERSDLGPVHLPAGVDVHFQRSMDERQILDSLARAMTSPPRDDLVPASAALVIGDGRLDVSGRVFVHSDGREVLLTRAELALLSALMRRPGQVLSRDQLSVAVAGHDAEPYGRSIDMHISRLRRKIETDPKAPQFILTASGGGYKFAGAGRKGRATLKEPVDLNQAGAVPPAPDARGLAEAVPQWSADQPAHLPHRPSEKRQITALSCELVSPAGLGDGVGLEELAHLVHRFQGVCAAVVAKMGGSLAGSAGQDVLAFFGLPRAHEDDAERAVHAAFDALAKVGELAWSSGEKVRLRIGIATGLVVISDGGVIGEPTSAAPRLRSMARPGAILAAPTTCRLLGRAFVSAGPQSYEFAGSSEQVIAYTVTERRSVQSRFSARQAPRLTQFVGREHELRQLMTLWARAQTRRGQIALICGEAGIGKSRVSEEFLERIQTDPHVAIRYQCSPHHTHSPFRPIIDQIEHAARFKQGDAPAIRLKKLEAALAEAGSPSLADMEACALLLSIPTAQSSTSGLTPQRQKDLAIAALTRYVLGLARTKPVVVELADAHWADSSTLELFARIIASIKTAQVMVLSSFRPQFFPPWLDEQHVTMLRLDRLGREQADAMIFDVAGQRSLPPDIHAQIISKTDGVPLFVEELTKSVLESGLDQQHGAQASGATPTLAIPTTLLGSLTARLDRLGAAKEIAQIGAAIGRQFSYRLLAAVAPAAGMSLDAALAQLAALELIFVRGEAPHATYIFKHALVRDAAYGTLVRDKQQELHRRIAAALDQVSPEIIETQPELLAHHLIQGGLTEQAIHYLQLAGRRTIERSANAEAIGHLTLALDLLRSNPETSERRRAALELEVLLAQAMIAGYGYAAAQTSEVLQRAKADMDAQTEPAMKLSILYGIWACHYVRAEVDAQTGAAAEFLAEAERHGDSGAMCVAHRIVGTTHLTKGELAAGLPHLEQASALYDPQAHASLQYRYGQDLGAAASCYLSWALWLLGRVDQARDAAGLAMKRARDSGHPHTLVFAIGHAQAMFDILQRRPDEMQSFADSIISLCHEHDLSHWLACGRIVEGWAAVTHADVDRGIALLRAGVAAWQKAGARLWLPLFQALEAEACARAGRVGEAVAAIARAVATAESSGERWYLAEILRMKAGFLSTAGHPADEVEAALAASLDVARAQGARSWQLRTACDLAALHQNMGWKGDASALLRPIVAEFAGGSPSADLQRAQQILDGEPTGGRSSRLKRRTRKQ